MQFFFGGGGGGLIYYPPQKPDFLCWEQTDAGSRNFKSFRLAAVTHRLSFFFFSSKLCAMCIFVWEGGGEEGGEQIIVATEKESPRGGVFEKEKMAARTSALVFVGIPEKEEKKEKRGE